jgi:hypothetical protein
MMRREERALRRLAPAYNRKVEPTNGGQYRLVRPGVMPVIAAATPSCWRALRNCEALLRRADRQAERD